LAHASASPRSGRPPAPGGEFLEYLSPRDGRPAPADARANHLAHWQTTLVTRDAEAVTKAVRGSPCAMSSPGVLTPADRALGFAQGL